MSITSRLREVRDMVDPREEPDCITNINRMLKAYRRKNVQNCQKYLCRAQDATGYEIQQELEDIWTEIVDRQTEDGIVEACA